ncbi:type II secretion system protein G (GspG) [Halopseudomonas litoralis]|uniref:Type II secretion system protein G (GspG) n=2 Tax=Halopseudomonas litoralis TaxID=797277 RepID=A0A1H1QCJ4_9GAMM|nr:type II secretion system protein G (GspG) [Halopseudomonas litoralis]
MIELMVALAVIALLLTLVAPGYLNQEARAREEALRYNLHMLRKTLDDFHADKGRYPEKLDDLLSNKYLRAIPPDPMTGRNDSWKLIAAEGNQAGIYDIKSTAQGQALDGTRYVDW